MLKNACEMSRTLTERYPSVVADHSRRRRSV